MDIENSLALFRAFLEIRNKPTFYMQLVHNGVLEKEFKDFLDPIFDLARSCPSSSFQVFFDELNTTCSMGLMASLVGDRLFLGKFVPPNVQFKGGINPPQEEGSTLQYNVNKLKKNHFS